MQRSARVALACNPSRPLASTSTAPLSSAVENRSSSSRSNSSLPAARRRSSSRASTTADDGIEGQDDGGVRSFMHHSPHLPAGRRVNPEFLSLLYSTFVPPPLATIHALAARIPHANLSDHVKLVEQCCILPSFWNGVAAVGNPPSELGWTKGGGVLATKYSHFCDEERLDNEELATLGSTLLGLFASEWLLARYPHLPADALQASVTAYTGPVHCAELARSWGIFAGSAVSPVLENKGSKEPSRGTGEAYRAGSGPLRMSFLSSVRPIHDQVTRASYTSPMEDKKLRLEHALSSAVRSIVAAVHSVHGFSAAREFVYAHFLARPFNMTVVLKSSNPAYALAATLARYSLPKAEVRMLKESGRDTNLPIFIIGVFSGSKKLGEGFGSSIKMATFRAHEDALRRIYLSRSFANAFGGSDGATVTATEEERLPSLPSDTVADANAEYRPNVLGDEAAEAMSSGRTGWTRAEAMASPFREDLLPMPKNVKIQPGSPKLRKTKVRV